METMRRSAETPLRQDFRDKSARFPGDFLALTDWNIQ
jgi:hypothetical protein